MLFVKMARNMKKKLAIFAGTSMRLLYAEAKYCASEMPGERKYYECSRTEYCCAFGCCVSPGLHLHHLWYYWILVIIMFLVCFGGGWWYRYWLQGRYRAAASTIPTRTTTTRPQNSSRGSGCQGQRARITYNSARNTVLLHRMWKGPQRNGTSAGYNGNATTSTHYQNVNVVLNDANCPYYQLYGPPPSYETVIAQTRGKLSDPASPESSSACSNLQPGNTMPTSPNVARCFSYACTPATRLNNGSEQAARYQNGEASPRQIEQRDPVAPAFVHFPRYCPGGTIRQNVCLPYDYQERSFVTGDGFDCAYQGNPTSYLPYPVDKSSDTSDPENSSYDTTSAERYAIPSIGERSVNGIGAREHGPWDSNDQTISRVHGKTENGSVGRTGKLRGQRRRDVPEEIGFSSLREIDENVANDTNDSKSSVTSFEDLEPEFSRERRIYGGSLRTTGRYAGGKTNREEYTNEEGVFARISPRSCDGMINSERANLAAVADSSHSQSNPSNNVILESFVTGDASPSTENVGKNVEDGSRRSNGSTNSDFESKTRLDRSKSLD